MVAIFFLVTVVSYGWWIPIYMNGGAKSGKSAHPCYITVRKIKRINKQFEVHN